MLAKASLTSKSSTSFLVRPVCWRTLGMLLNGECPQNGLNSATRPDQPFTPKNLRPQATLTHSWDRYP